MTDEEAEGYKAQIRAHQRLREATVRSSELVTRQTFWIEVTRAEFLALPMAIRRKALKKQTEQMLLIEQWEQK